MSFRSRFTTYGFTIVELVVVIAVLGILAAITIIAYGSWQHTNHNNVILSDIQHATIGLESHKNFKNDYPPNLADINFAPSDDVALKMSTNAPQTRVYDTLTPPQNAQLLLNSCNASMPILSADGSQTFNSACAFSGNNIHIPGNFSFNVVLQGPTINKAEFVLTCGATCTAASSTIISEFESQGGTFPITVPSSQVALPAPTITSYGSATAYCLEARSVTFDDIIYHTSNVATTPVAGACPNDPALHYP